MSGAKSTDFGSELVKLAKLLEECPEVTRYDTETEKQAWTLAHDLLDLEESCNIFTQRLMPQLNRGDSTPAERYQVLLEIGEELRHMLYHIRDSRFYEHITEP